VVLPRLCKPGPFGVCFALHGGIHARLPKNFTPMGTRGITSKMSE
jgi:hypothetical protein